MVDLIAKATHVPRAFSWAAPGHICCAEGSIARMFLGGDGNSNHHSAFGLKHSSSKAVDCVFFHYFYDFFPGTANFLGVNTPNLTLAEISLYKLHQ